MKVTLISKENNIAKFDMVFKAEEFDAAIIKAYQTTKEKYVVDGFRRGKAPRKLIETHYGEDVFFEDAINDMVSSGYPQALAELKLDTIGDPIPKFGDITKGQDFNVSIIVECYPEIEVKDYKGVKIEKVEHKIGEEELEAEMANMAKKNARMLVVERAAQLGDTIVLDYSGFVGENQFQGGTAERQMLKLGSGQFIPGFEEQLVGVAAGEDKDVMVTFPEQYHSEELAGAEAVFKCKVHEVKEEQLPELNDDFAKDISEFDTIEELKKDILERLEKAAAARAESEMKNSAVDKVVEANKFDPPRVMIEDEIEHKLKEFDQQLQYQGLNIDLYCEYLGKDIQSLKDEIRDEAAKAVVTRIVVSAIVEAEDIQVSEEEMDKELELMAMQYKLDVAKIREMLGDSALPYIEKDVKMRKAVDFIFKNAEIL